MSTFIRLKERTPITSISKAMTATESGRRSANLTSAIIGKVPQLSVPQRIGVRKRGTIARVLSKGSSHATAQSRLAVREVCELKKGYEIRPVETCITDRQIGRRRPPDHQICPSASQMPSNLLGKSDRWLVAA